MAKRSSSKGRSTRSKSRSSAAPAAVEVVEEAPGENIDAGIAIATTLLLLVAFLFVDYTLGNNYSQGLFFK